jgi:hypothetical protein
MSTAAVVDDGVLVRLLIAGAASPSDLPLRTTFCWWWRLTAATRARRGGRLSAPVLTAGDAEQAVVLAAVERLPEIVQIEDPRAVLPLAADLHALYGLQLLAAEAAAVALTVDAEIVVSVDNPNLAGACRALDIPYRVAATSG